ncbi:hypothetical protein NX821_003202 (plasmid) [Clostridium septicum]|uniref:hypothetical protein n=1 Tax=Clostridium septicum TaxID=1504 RepID=UPI000834C461|nr:hypothetical protein [Clostridium septicum]
MNNSIKAVIWKELRSAQHRKKQIFINTICIFIFITIIAVIRLLNLKSTTEITDTMATNMVIYIAVTGNYMSLLAVLRFWQEKSNKTIETLLSLPSGVISIMLAKSVVPIILGIFIGLLDSILAVIVMSILYNKLILSLGMFLVPVIFGICIGIPYCFINGYSMWCMSITYSKLMQGASSIAYVALITVMVTNYNISYINFLKVILLCSGILFIFSLYLTSHIDKEKIVLNLLD